MISMSPLRFALCATIVALLFISSAYGEELTVSVSEGSGAGSITSTSNFGAAANNAVEQAITLNPKEDTAKNALYVEGPYSTSRSVSGNYGGYCYSGFSVTGVNAKSTYDFWADGSSYAQLSESLQTSTANNINAFGYAFSNYGYAADVLDVTSNAGQAQANYFNYAYANPSYAYDYAAVGSASGNYAGATSFAYNYDWKDHAITSFYAESTLNPAIIWNVEQSASSVNTYANSITTKGNSWSPDGYIAQSSYASDLYGDYSYNYLYSTPGYTAATSTYYPDYAYSSGSNRNTWAAGSADVYGSPTYAWAENYNSYNGWYYWAWDYYEGENTLSQYGYNSFDDSYAVNFQY